MLLSSKSLILPKLFAPFHQEIMHSCYEPICYLPVPIYIHPIKRFSEDNDDSTYNS